MIKVGDEGDGRAARSLRAGTRLVGSGLRGGRLEVSGVGSGVGRLRRYVRRLGRGMNRGVRYSFVKNHDGSKKEALS